ncbi:MAG: nicotinamide-nucleotide adenylyltransferase [Candidatus Freyarchaeota archaeon]|nr:nicotinamide-nucleotide adenylyltransferase [Candidatus Jordarchaeia archaeon]
MKSNKDRGLFIGRFQPFHSGHLHAVKTLLNDVEELIIGVGSAQYSHTLKDPFSAGERILMIRLSLEDDGVPASRYLIIPIPDLNDNRLWVAHVVSLVPPFRVVYSNNSLVKVLFEEAGYEVRPVPFYHRDKYCATRIREKIAKGEEWRDLVPPAVVKVIEEVRGVERIRMVVEGEHH